MVERFKRVNVLIGGEQYKKVQESGLNLSGLVRDLIDDRFSHRRVVLSVSQETRRLYDHVISNFGATDQDLERFFLEALDALLEEKVSHISDVRAKLKGAPKK
jgi:hypothetical protein